VRGFPPGEIVVFDKAYVDFEHLGDLDQREVWWVSRAKENMAYKVKKPLTRGVKGILKDQLVSLKNARHEGMLLRRVEALVEIDGEERRMVFITNNLSWSPRSVCDLSRRRWDIEVFFKQVKQTLRLSNFWVTAPTQCAGRCTRLCWCTSCCASRDFCAPGRTASRGSLRWCDPQSGNGSTCSAS
jgi:hypothetical protein